MIGRCECGATAYEVPDEFLYEQEKVVVTKGGAGLLVWGDPDGKNHTRCGTCGSPLFSVVGRGRVHVALGSLRGVPSIRPTDHIFVGSKAPWFEITDALPQHEELD